MKMHQRILLVEDEPTQRRLMEQMLESKLGYEVMSADGGREAMRYVTHSPQAPSLILLDLEMPDMSGLEVIHAVRLRRNMMPIIVLTAHADLENAIAAIRAGANDFLTKPASIERLQVSLENALAMGKLHEEVEKLERIQHGHALFSDIITQAECMHAAIMLGQRAAQSDISVLIQGESGVGKELFARAIHGSSAHASAPFVAVNCGAIPENLIESTLFGHEKGAFTGAVASAPGKFREADGGTLFLDEIAELKPEMQIRLLRVLQEGQIEPVGAGKPVQVNVRVLSATHQNLEARVKTGSFREDLFYRINAFPITLPPLRERGGDISLLAHYFLEHYAARESKHITRIAANTMAGLIAHPWPGNVRELENAIFRAVVLCDEEELHEVHFPQIFACSSDRKLLSSGVNGAGSNGKTGLHLLNPQGELRSIQQLEEETIRFALTHYNGHMSEIARRLGIGRSTLYRKIQDYGIEHPRLRDSA